MQQSTIGGMHFAINPTIDGYNQTKHWKTIAGTIEASSGNIQIGQNDDMGSYFALGMKFDIDMRLTIPAVPTAGDARRFGLENPDLGNEGRLGFSIDDDVLNIRAYDESGTALALDFGESTPAWRSAWTNTETSFRIKHTGGQVSFFIGGVLIARTKTAPITPLRVRIKNTTADTILLGGLNMQNVQYFS